MSQGRFNAPSILSYLMVRGRRSEGRMGRALVRTGTWARAARMSWKMLLITLSIGVMGLFAAALLLPGTASAGGDAKAKRKKPKLEMRALPRIGIAPVEVLAIASLVDGDDTEEFYCPELEWEWDDDATSIQEIDCPAFEPGMKIERRFTARHLYSRQGSYSIQLRLKNGGRTVASTSAEVDVRRGLGEFD
ncbi:MAG: hypothetical protein JXO72_13490 [Vicinamibacteria bacterium]|nr:hypothetical protein [Vicinamibacteria bacterium]